MEQPNLKILDLAIRCMKSSHYWFSCSVLESAYININGVQLYLSNSSTIKEYKTQYRRWTMKVNGGKKPKWWNSLPHNLTESQKRKYRDFRVAALESFRQACIDAAKERV